MSKQIKPDKAEGDKDDARAKIMMLGKEDSAKMLETGKQQQLAKEENEARKKIQELEEKLIRLQADFQNHIKRSEKQQAESSDAMRANMLLDILTVIDQFEFALQHEKSESEFKKGVEMIYKNLMAVLKNLGLKEMDSYERFDPYLHEAVKTEKGEDGKILKVIQKGYMFKEKVLRHAKVIVGRKN